MVKDKTELRREVSNSRLARANAYYTAFSHHHCYLLPALGTTNFAHYLIPALDFAQRLFAACRHFVLSVV